MMGCAEIQPFMYFQLQNIPMFKGAYTVFNVQHHITANHMTTTFKGLRIKTNKTKMIDDSTLYANLILNLNDVNNDGATLNDLPENLLVNTTRFSDDDKTYIIDANDVDRDIAGTFSDPLKSMYITSQFAAERSFAKGVPHQGIDYRARTPIDFYAVTDMVLVRIRYQPEVKGKVNGGLYLDFKVKDKNLWIRYMHLSELTNSAFEGINVTPGMDITSGGPIGKIFKEGVVIGKTGSSGNAAPHLHFDIRTNQASVSGIKYKKNPNLFFKSNTDKFDNTQDNKLSN